MWTLIFAINLCRFVLAYGQMGTLDFVWTATLVAALLVHWIRLYRYVKNEKLQQEESEHRK